MSLAIEFHQARDPACVGVGGTSSSGATGTVVAESRLELQASCDIEGVIHARAQHLHLEEGARFNGQVQMLDADGVRALPAGPGENSTHAEAFSTAM